MELIPVTDTRFSAYGQVLEGYDFSPLLEAARREIPLPEHGASYLASVPALEAMAVAAPLRNRGFGGLAIEIGCCFGYNSRLTSLEYHRTSELDIACDDLILLLACQTALSNRQLDTRQIQAFLLPAGVGVELFATTLHYTPCGTERDCGFRMVCVLPRGTNLQKPDGLSDRGEDLLCFGANKWVLTGRDTDEARAGAFIGITGTSIDLFPKM